MLVYEYKLDGNKAQYSAIEEGIRVVQFLRNKCIRAWMDRADEGKSYATMSAVRTNQESPAFMRRECQLGEDYQLTFLYKGVSLWQIL